MRNGHRVLVSRWSIVAGVFWIIRYATLGTMPWNGPPLWLPWFDQSRYLESAVALAHGNLAPSVHWYPLGYPLLAAPFVWLMPTDPFILPDLILFLLTCKAFQNVVGRLGIGLWPATFCFLATTLIDTKTAGGWAQPWTTTLSAALIWWLMDRVLCAADEMIGEREARSGAIIGALAAALPLVRPVDALISFTCIAAWILLLAHRRRLSFRLIGATCLAGLGVAGAYGALHVAIYGLRPTPYMLASAATGFIWADLGWKAYILLVHARPWFPGHPGDS